ncbi:MAG: amino acid adenylation domain-containing protein [Terriglobales bacterium]
MNSQKLMNPLDLAGQPSAQPGFDFPDCLAQDLFVAQAVRAPERPALISVSGGLSYGELLSASRMLGHQIRALGVKPNTLVAIVMDKGWEQVVGVLGALQAGAAYLPIDANVPPDRLRYLLEDGEVEVVLTQSWLDERLKWPANIVRLSVDQPGLLAGDAEPLARVQTPEDIAYVLYTSGSTGKPKGVMIGHRGLVNCVLETNRAFHVKADDRVLAVTALHHDMSVYDIFGVLAAGGSIVMPDRGGTRSPDHWVDLITQLGVTVWNSVPAFMEMLLVHAAARKLVLRNRLRLAFLGGDWIPLSAPARIREHFGDVQVVSVGGPTETTVWNIWYPVKQVQPGWKSIPYGHPIANTHYYVFDENLNECPDGEPGELCCAGVGLLKGYWRNPEQTAARTAVHPRTGERIYRTGDRGRLMPDGEIEFLGRIDRQIKINGQRIELGEIEATLIRQPGVKQAVVDAIEADGQKSLVAYIVPEGGLHLEPSELRAAVENFLPAHMLPSSFLILETLPLNANGKVDRSLLPAPERSQAISDGLPAMSGVEATISSVWSRVLGVEQVSPTDNFFDLGGDSILLVQVHAELQEALGRVFSVTDLFQYCSIRSLGKYLEGQTKPQFTGDDIADRISKRRKAMAQQRRVRQLS